MRSRSASRAWIGQRALEKARELAAVARDQATPAREAKRSFRPPLLAGQGA